MNLLLKYFPHLNPLQQEQFTALYPLYLEWNSKINVISRKDLDNLYCNHVLHSLSIAKVISFKPGAQIMDLGTGGGFPGIPLAILFPETKFLLVDSIGKKLKVVEAVSDAIKLSNVRILNERGENIKEKFDFVISRAVTDFSEFVSWVTGKFSEEQKHTLHNGILYLKGGDLSEELKDFLPGITQYHISKFFEEPFFETKKVIYLPVKA